MAGGAGIMNFVTGVCTGGGDYPDFSEDMGILANILDSEDHGQKISSLSMQHLFHVLWTVFMDGLYELVVVAILDWP